MRHIGSYINRVGLDNPRAIYRYSLSVKMEMLDLPAG